MAARRASWRRVAGRLPAAERTLRSLRRADTVEDLQRRLTETEERHRPAAELYERLRAAGLAAVFESADLDAVGPFLRWAPPGHFYSPIPDLTALERDAGRVFARPEHLPGLDLRADEQVRLYRELAAVARTADFPPDRGDRYRYWYRNPSYGIGDALILHAMLRRLQPRRYLEIGGGWSTALALDTNEFWLDNSVQVTCVEPYPEAVRGLIRPGDPVELVERPVQELPVDFWSRLEPGDVLLVDGSHVVKSGSDAHHIVTRVLPVIPAGVHVHVHDVIWPFDYPQPWVREGRAWSEAYLLHAFLLFNPVFDIVLFADWIAGAHPDLIAAELPAARSSPGGALWLRRTG